MGWHAGDTALISFDDVFVPDENLLGELEAGRCLTYHALRLHHAGQECIKEVTMAKLATQRACFDVMDTCLQIHGGNGYMVEYDIERAARDARLGPIGGGTDEIIGKTMGL